MYAGKTIAHYEVGEKLGRGGMGVVYQARDTKLDRTVALKFLSRELSEDEDAKQRFIREAKSASALDHANICTIHDIAETDDGEMYIVMAYYKGQTLKYRLENEDFSVERATSIARQIGLALERAHEANIIHRDIKPANVMVSDKDEVKLLDFGLAKLTTGLDLTREGSTVGTAGYMSPEQARGEEVTTASDVWSLGVLTYEMIAGKKPFGGAYEQAMIYGILNEDPPPLTEVRRDVPEEVANAVHQSLAKEVSDRFPTALEFLGALDGAVSTSAVAATSHARDGGGTAARKKLIVVAVVAVVATLVAASSIFGLVSRSTDGDKVVSEDVVAVLPFSVLGSEDVQYLGEGIVNLLSNKLDGAGSFQSVDPRAVIAMVNDRELDVKDPKTGSIVAGALGAGRYVTGDFFESGDNLNVSATLHNSGAPDEPVGKAAKEGPTQSVFDLIDQVATELLAGSLTGPDARLQQLATLTSASLTATKEFLRGEKLLRDGLYRDAATAYEEAVRLDSSFALAYFRKSLAGDWTDAPDRTTTAEKALELSVNLSPRDRTLVRALRDQRIGRRRAAEQAYRTHLVQYPDEVEPLLQLAELYFHDNPRRGEPIAKARQPFERTLELEPRNVIAQVHLARIDALEGEYDLLKERATFFRSEVPNSERTVEVDAIYAYSVDDTTLQRSVAERLQTGPWFYFSYVVLGVTKFARDPIAAAEILESRTSDEDILLSLIPGLDIITGQYNRARQFAIVPGDRKGGSWDTYNSFILTTGVMPVDEDHLRNALERVRSADPEDILNTQFLAPHDSFTPAVAEFERDWNVANILIDLGQLDDARTIIARLKEIAPFDGLGTVKEDAVAGLEGTMLYKADDPTGALTALRSMVFDTPHFITWRPFGEVSRARFLLANLELEAGELDRAKGIFTGFLESWSPFDAFYTPHVYERLGFIAEEQGRVDEAVFYYAKLVEIWQNCDPELKSVRDDVQRRLDSILTSGTRETPPTPVTESS